MVTGGAKGITAQCALEFARSSKAQMALIGRSPVPENKKDDSNEIVQTLKQFEKENLIARYYSCDVSSEKDVVSTIGKIEKKLGKITGVIHGAGLNSLKRLKQTNVQEVFQEALPKVMGAVNICKALSYSRPLAGRGRDGGQTHLKLIVGITSIIGLTGMEGSGWYGFSNEILNLYLHQFKNQNPDTDVVTIAYSIWDEIGMGTKLGSISRLAEKGIGAIPVKEGIRHFQQLVEGDPGTQQVVVAARVAGIPTWKSQELKPNNFRFLEKIEYILPGVELIARANLNIEDDPYLLDHNWKGSLLFPFVFGFEAMAQAVAYVLGIEKFDHIKAKDINLLRPITVPQGSETTIEIHAQVLEQEKDNGYTQVKVEIYSQETAYQEPHFSEIFEVDKKIPVENINKDFVARSKNILDIDPQTGLYGPILFQGKMFQYINKIHELMYNMKTRKGQALLTALREESRADFIKTLPRFNNYYLIGDPFLLDSALQAMQLIIPQDLSLPKKIAEIDIVSLNQIKENNEYIISLKMFKVSNEQGIGDAEVFSGDRLFFRIKDCDLKILQTIPERPSAYDLVNPTSRDQRIIENKLSELTQEISFEVPVIRCLYDNRLVDAKKEFRHKIETPLIKEAVIELFKRDKKLVGGFKIGWQKNGKPVVTGRSVKDVGVSVSHDGSFLLIMVGNEEQGCDVESIVKRTDHDWLVLLGEAKHKLLKVLVNKGMDADIAGALVWTGIETAKKISQDFSGDIEYLKSNNQCVFFSAADRWQIIAVTTLLTSGKKIVFSFATRMKGKSLEQESLGSKILSRMGYNKNIFGIDADGNGPQGQLVYIQRFPVTFKNNQSISRRVYFTNYFGWMGEVRETGLSPIMKRLTNLAETGEWGVATNSSSTKILGELQAHDVVEVRLWFEKVSGLKGGSFDTVFEWRKVLENNKFERVAISKLQSTWIQITGRGVAVSGDIPNFLRDFVDSMKPKFETIRPLPFLPETLKGFSQGEAILDSPKKGLLIFQESFKTALEDANLIGNIYFANYPKWLGRTMDAYFYKTIPEFFTGSPKGEFLCLNCELEHLRESMPFDEIVVKMYLEEMFERGMNFHFEVFGPMKQGNLKLAVARTSMLWVGRNLKLDPIVSEMPKKFNGL